MKLQTNIPFKKEPHHLIDYDSKILLLGSCFSENIGGKFNYFKFQSAINPFGILFHPLAIENLIARAINNDYYNESELNFNNEQWCCLDTHSKLNTSSPNELVISLNANLDLLLDKLKTTRHIIITLGTAWVYRHIVSDKIVANCHKIPQIEFQKELLSVKEISESLDAIVSLVRTINPKVNFIFTVSPVRHLKDGFVENTQSKSHLVAAVHEVVEPRKQIYYFPSYEIMMDELRDYRFYNSDMIHPNDTAIDYIWEKFQKVWFSDSALETIEEVNTIQKGANHRPFNPNSKSHQDFIQNLKQKVERLHQRYSHISFPDF